MLKSLLGLAGLVAYVVVSALGVWMILYARAARMSVRGGVLVILCSAAGIVTALLPPSDERSLARVLLGPLTVLSIVVFIYTWRDAVTTGKFEKPKSLRSIIRGIVRT